MGPNGRQASTGEVVAEWVDQRGSGIVDEKDGWWLIFGGGLIALGSFLPWITFSGAGPFSRSGLDRRDGVITLVCGAVVGIIGGYIVSGRSVTTVFAASCGRRSSSPPSCWVSTLLTSGDVWLLSTGRSTKGLDRECGLWPSALSSGRSPSRAGVRGQSGI